MNLQNALVIGSAGLSAQRTRMEIVTSNLTNANTTRTPEGGPYRRMMPVFSAQPLGSALDNGFDAAVRSVVVDQIVTDDSDPIRRHDPSHPDADENGYVAYPNINVGEEMVDMLSATRSYEANVTIIKNVRDLMRSTLEIIS